MDARSATSTRLGVVIDGSLTKGLTARLRKDCSIEDVRVGRFVKVQGDKFDFFCLITDVALGTANARVLDEPPDPADTFMHDVLLGTTTFGAITVQPMLMLNKGAVDGLLPDEIGRGPQPVRTIPAHFAPVDNAAEEDFAHVFAEPGEGSWVIGSPLDMDVDVRLDLARIAERSNGIFGKSGTGKSMLTRLLLCGLIRSKRAVNLIFDMHSEYAWPTRDKATGQMLKSLPDLFGNWRVTVYALASKQSTPKNRQPEGFIRIGLNEIEIEDIALLSELLNLNDTAVETIYLLRQDEQFGDRWLARLLRADREEMAEVANRSGANPASVAALKRHLNRLLELDFITEELVSADQSDINKLVRSLEEGQNVVLAFEHADDLLPYMLVVNIITRRIHERWRKNTQRAHGEDRPEPPQLVITVEEAHRFLSPAASRHTSFGTIAREMRKFNVTLLVVDQRPSGIDPEVLSQIGTRFTCQLNDENDIAAILAGVSGASHLRSVLASLDSQQQSMLLGHAVPMPVVVKVRTIDERFYEEVTAGPFGPVFPNGRRARDLLARPDD